MLKSPKIKIVDISAADDVSAVDNTLINNDVVVSEETNEMTPTHADIKEEPIEQMVVNEFKQIVKNKNMKHFHVFLLFLEICHSI